MKFALLSILLLLAWILWRAWQTGPLPEAGTVAPDFRLHDQNGKLHTLSDYAGRWLVLYFYPKDDTPGCTREACSFRDGHARLQATGAAVLGVSIDTSESHGRFAKKFQLSFPLLADTDGSTARRYGVLMDWKAYKLAKRTTFLINPAGEIMRVYERVDPDSHVDQILADLPGVAAQ